MKIEYNKVTWYSTLIAVILYVGTFLFAFYLGQQSQSVRDALSTIKNTDTSTQASSGSQDNVINSVEYNCDNGKTIHALYFREKVELTLSDGRNMLLPQAISASGTRYANSDESFVFWSKGDTAFVQEDDSTTFDNCTASQE